MSWTEDAQQEAAQLKLRQDNAINAIENGKKMEQWKKEEKTAKKIKKYYEVTLSTRTAIEEILKTARENGLYVNNAVEEMVKLEWSPGYLVKPKLFLGNFVIKTETEWSDIDQYDWASTKSTSHEVDYVLITTWIIFEPTTKRSLKIILGLNQTPVFKSLPKLFVKYKPTVTSKIVEAQIKQWLINVFS